jgi:hypothetical protein
MYNTMEEERKPLSLVIGMQYFADETGGETTDANTQNSGEKTQTPPTLKELLASNKTYQSEFDKMTSKSQETAVANARAKWEADAKAKADEAAKLAAMDAEKKAAYERQKLEKELADREAAVTRRELKAEARLQLAEKGLPTELADILDYSNAESCKASMDATETAFKKSVENVVNERLKGGQPPKKGDTNGANAYDGMSIDELSERMETHPAEHDAILLAIAKRNKSKK